MTNDVEHLVTCLLLICMSPLEKCLFKSFAHFLDKLLLVFLLLSGKRFLHILDNRYVICKCFSPILWVVSLFSLWSTKLLILMTSNLLLFSFVICVFSVIYEKSFLTQSHEDVLLWSLLSVLQFYFLGIHFKLIFLCSER